MKKNIIWMILLLAIVCFLFSGLYAPLQTTYYTITSDRLPQSFDGLCIVQISDFHCKKFGDDEDKLIAAVKACKPDIILLTGDMIDRDHETDNVGTLLEGLSDVAPLYAVAGNHETDITEKYIQLVRFYLQYGVNFLEDEAVTLVRDGESIEISGIPFSTQTHKWRISKDTREYRSEQFRILLYHYANEFDVISEYGYDVVFSGHVHGGIVRLPMIGGIIGTEGLFPKYDKGVYVENDSAMIVSAGLGDTVVPRFYNPPEVVCVTLFAK